MTYFDHNAASPLLPEAKQAWLEANEVFTGNPSSQHRVGQRADRALNEGREKLAHILGCDPLQIIWTSGATESNNAVLNHFRNILDGSSKIWVSAIEHPSVIEPANAWFGARVRHIPAQRSGTIDLNWLEEHLKASQPGLVAVLAANNETGVVQPWREVLALCRNRNVPLFCDATQWLGKLPAAGLGECDFITGSAHKFGGPRGVGFLKLPKHGVFAPLLHGGTQEETRRAGTENVPGVLAMIAALELRERQLKNGDAKPREDWKQHFERCLMQQLPGAEIIGSNTARLWNTTSVVMPELRSCENQHRWVVKLDKAGFAVSTGSACASGREEPSHVLQAMGYSPSEASRVLRFSSGWETTEADWNSLLAALQRIHSDLQPGARVP